MTSRSDEPYEIPGEEEEENKKTGRSAYFAGVHAAADGYSGSFRGVPSIPHGGAASVKDEDIMGSGSLCWCGDRYGHDWPGKDRGAKHPRGESMNTAVRSEEHFDPSVLKTFDRRVAKMIADLANDFGVRVRMQDGSHAILYPPDGSRPFKVAAARKAEEQMEYIEKFARAHVAPVLITGQAEALAARFNDPTKRPRRKKETVRAATVVPEPAPVVPEAPPVIPEATPQPKPDEDGWSVWIVEKTGEPSRWLVNADETEWKCSICGHLTPSKGGMGGHMRAHSDKAMAAAARSGRNQHIQTLLTKLARACDVDLSVNSDAQTRKVAKLQEQLDKVTAERDDYKARLDLMREAMKA